MSNLSQNKKKGALMVEVVVVASIMVASVLVMMSVAQKSISISRRSIHTAQASFLLEEGAEVMRILRDENWDNINNLDPNTTYYINFSGSSWSITDTPSKIDAFTRSINIASVNRDPNDDIGISGTDDPKTKLITITVIWDEGGVPLSKDISFYIADIFS